MEGIAPRYGRVEFALPEPKGPQDLPAAHAALLKEIAAGELSPEQGAFVAEILEKQRLAFDTAQLTPILLELKEKDRKLAEQEKAGR